MDPPLMSCSSDRNSESPILDAPDKKSCSETGSTQLKFSTVVAYPTAKDQNKVVTESENAVTMDQSLPHESSLSETALLKTEQKETQTQSSDKKTRYQKAEPQINQTVKEENPKPGELDQEKEQSGSTTSKTPGVVLQNVQAPVNKPVQRSERASDLDCKSGGDGQVNSQPPVSSVPAGGQQENQQKETDPPLQKSPPVSLTDPAFMDHPTIKKLIVWAQENATNREILLNNAPLIFKMCSIDWESARPELAACYGTGGIAPRDCVSMFRAFALNLMTDKYGLTKFAHILRTNQFYSILCGFDPDPAPALATYYAFIERLERAGQKLSANGMSMHELRQVLRKNGVERRKPMSEDDYEVEYEKGKTKTESIYEKLKALQNAALPKTMETLMNTLILKLGVSRSLDLNYLSNEIDVYGDSTPIRSGAAKSGIKLCDCCKTEKCTCKRRYSDPNAAYGYHPSISEKFFGYRAYLLTANHNQHDLVLGITLRPGNYNDFLMVMQCYEQVRKGIRDQKLPVVIKRFISDAGTDSVFVHRFFIDRGVEPLIDIRDCSQEISCSGKNVCINALGIPLCPHGAELRLHTVDKRKNLLVWTCPAKKGTHSGGKYCYVFHKELCPIQCDCEPTSSLKPIVYCKMQDDPRIFPQTPRNSSTFLDAMDARSCVERLNNVVKNNYAIDHHFRSDPNFFFHLALAAILHHATIWLKEAIKNNCNPRQLLQDALDRARKETVPSGESRMDIAA